MRSVLRDRAASFGRVPTYFVETLGCQMNAKDSEKFAGILTEIGYREAPGEFDADLVLYREALAAAGLTGHETVWDLYCGTGTISLFLARQAAWVHGVEVVEAAVEDARANASRNSISNVDFIAARAEELLPRLHREGQLKADVVVVDPPRKGCGKELLDTLLDLAPEKIVYVSCDPATLARDIKVLSSKYVLGYAQPVDMFPQTVGVECIALLQMLHTGTGRRIETGRSRFPAAADNSAYSKDHGTEWN